MRQLLPQEQLQCVFDVIIVSGLLYEAPAWRGLFKLSRYCLFTDCMGHAKRWKVICIDIKIVNLFDRCY